MFKNQRVTAAPLCACVLGTMSSFSLADAHRTAVPGVFDSGSAAGRVFGRIYSPTPEVSANQAQVVYYRPITPSQAKNAVKIHLNGEIQTALLPNGYVTFCMAPGRHALGGDKVVQPIALEGALRTSSR